MICNNDIFLFVDISIVDTGGAATMFPVTSTVAPLTTAELVTVRVTLSGTRVVWQRELGPTSPVLPPQSHPVSHLLVRCPVVHTCGTLAVVSTRATVAPVGTTVILNN